MKLKKLRRLLKSEKPWRLTIFNKITMIANFHAFKKISLLNPDPEEGKLMRIQIHGPVVQYSARTGTVFCLGPESTFLNVTFYQCCGF